MIYSTQENMCRLYANTTSFCIKELVHLQSLVSAGIPVPISVGTMVRLYHTVWTCLVWPSYCQHWYNYGEVSVHNVCKLQGTVSFVSNCKKSGLLLFISDLVPTLSYWKKIPQPLGYICTFLLFLFKYRYYHF